MIRYGQPAPSPLDPSGSAAHDPETPSGPPMSTDLQHGFADLGDVTIHYVAAGQGPAVVLIHRWPQTWYMWRDIIRGLAHRYRVIVPDLRGLGDSSRPVAGYDKKTISDDIWRLAHDVLGEQRLFVVGHD